MTEIQILTSGFYKLSPVNNTFGEKPSFIYLDNPTEDVLSYIQLSVSSKYYDGAVIKQAEKSDPDFVNYLKNDLEKVNKDIEKLKLLKSRIENAINQI